MVLQSGAQLITVNAKEAAFTIASPSFTPNIITDIADHTLIHKSAELFAKDVFAVSGKNPASTHELPIKAKEVIIIGSIERSALVQHLVNGKKLDASPISGKWEGYLVQVVDRPFNGVDKALVIAGNDRRGTAFGVFEVARQMGVSPWYWWADVPVKKKPSIFIKKNQTIVDAPRVPYRGIFINDEAPALANWSREKFGGFNHRFYEKVFELMLRLKANYLWPAMWGNAFYDDDSLNIKYADDYGIVIGTSHHEPLMRAHDEWRRYGRSQKWNYDSTEEGLKEFWKKGMQRATNEKIVSIGMRGDGDEPMSEETATALLERIVKDQRKIIEEVTGKPADKTPQLWALYKEVQDYYDKGMRVPDDVTLLLCDDNWGNIRRLPPADYKPRAGGYGIYYHFDYVGGPRNYKWVNTNPLPRIWEQMHLAWQYNARKIWIVNVGDIKPMELPISFFLDYAWNPEKISADDLGKYTSQWAADQFGKMHAAEIADILSKYAKYNSRRKPELLDEKSFSLAEFERLTKEYTDLLEKAEAININLPLPYRDAYFQLVLHPVKACANLYQLYFTVAKNHLAYQLKDEDVNELADKARSYFVKDSLITKEYHSLGKGKWNHMMSQTHIGYTYWQQPPVQEMPKVYYLPADSLQGKTQYIKTIPRTAEHLVPVELKAKAAYEINDVVVIEADKYSSAYNSNGITWKVLPDHGKTGSAITSFPVTAPTQQITSTTPHVTYDIFTISTGSVKVNAHFSPTLNFHNSETGLRYAISIDEEEPQIISINKEDKNVHVWEKWVAENIIIRSSDHVMSKPGKHTVKYWMVDSGVVLQNIVLQLVN